MSNQGVYDILRGRIVSLELRPGMELNLSTLSSELNVSRSPLRDALLRLERDRLIDIFPQRGTRVSFLDMKTIMEERFMRICIELEVLKKSILKERSESEDECFITKLKCSMMQQHAALVSRNFLDYAKFDDEMHRAFYDEAGYENIYLVLEAHTGNEHRIRMLSYYTEGIAKDVETEHEALIEAVANKDIDRAVEIDREHLEKLQEEVASMKAAFPTYFEKD